MAVTITPPEFGGPNEEDVAFARQVVEAASTYLRECQRHAHAASAAGQATDNGRKRKGTDDADP